MSDENHEFETADAGAAHTYPSEAGALRKGGHVLLKGFPCKITEISISKTGKHGHAKAAITGNDIFTGKKKEDMCPTSHNMEVPNVFKNEFTLCNVDEDTGAVDVLLENGELKSDLNLPDATEELQKVAESIKTMFAAGDDVRITVLSAMGKEMIVDAKKGGS